MKHLVAAGVVTLSMAGAAHAAPAADEGCRLERESAVEAIAAQPGTGAFFAVVGGRLAVWDAERGQYATIKGAPKALEGVDGLSFDPLEGALYGVQRGALVQIDPNVGELIEGAFGAGQDRVVLGGLAQGERVRDLAIDPLDGQVFGAVESDERHAGRLIRIGRATGSTVEVGALVNPIDTIAMDSHGVLWAASTGGQRLFKVNKDTGRLSPAREAAGGALSCLCAGLEGGCDMDLDGDGLSNAREAALGTNPALADSDMDGVSDFDETQGGRFIDRNHNDVPDALEAPRQQPTAMRHTAAPPPAPIGDRGNAVSAACNTTAISPLGTGGLGPFGLLIALGLGLHLASRRRLRAPVPVRIKARR